MASFRVYVKVDWHDRTLWNSYYIISAQSKVDARKKARARAKEEHSPSPKAKLSINTSFDGFVK
jgi:hypothetical protein